MTKILGDEKVVLSDDLEAEEKRLHWVHIECHEAGDTRPPFVTAMCGIALDWDEQRQDSTNELCPECVSAPQCPNCKRLRAQLP